MVYATSAQRSPQLMYCTPVTWKFVRQGAETIVQVLTGRVNCRGPIHQSFENQIAGCAYNVCYIAWKCRCPFAYLPGFMRDSRSYYFWIVGILAAVAFFLLFLPDKLVEYLWLENLGYDSIFWRMLLIQSGLFVGIFALVAAYFGGNFYFLNRQLPTITTESGEVGVAKVGDLVLTKQRLGIIGAGIAAFFGLLFATSFAVRWEQVVRFFYGAPSGSVDPIYGVDLSFYLLRYPFLESLQGAMVGVTFMALLVVGTMFFLTGQVVVREGQLRVSPGVVKLLGINLTLFLVAWAWGFYLDRFGMLFTESGAVFGAGYVDVFYRIPALWTAVFATLALAALVAYNIYSTRIRLLLYGGGLYVAVLVIGLGLIPFIVDQVQLQPNELELEQPFLEHNVSMTRQAYGIDDVRERAYPARANITRAQLDGNEDVIANIRLWDPDLLIRTYRQLQEIRLYYQFYSIDIDRYVIDGEYRQVLLGARELTQRLPDRTDTWINRHLQFTHGYGIAMNFATDIDEEGNPELIVQDLPPQTDTDLDIGQMAIYYGLRTPTYRIVNTTIEELHFPSPEGNVRHHYSGQGGVQLDSYWKRALFAWNFSDFNVLLTDFIHDESRIQFHNRIQERVRNILPRDFLSLDGDPYVVVNDGRLFYIQDAFTTGRTYPYSETSANGRLNYIRDAVKVVIDAYEGSVDFYMVDEEDPILQSYAAAFPGVFQSLEDMPGGLRDHLRYPQDLFNVQVEKYQRYHMTDVRNFYNNEDLWTRPRESYDGRQQTMQPYYMLMRLPDAEDLNFFLMTPMTPDGRENMIGWLAANSDYPNYGELVVYNLPRERLIFGPNQIESRIDQDTEISRQVTLWDQRGSRVVRGNLLVVPIEESFLYVEPLYLIADNIEIPQLRRVIVSDGSRVVMEPTLEAGLQRLYGDPIIADAPALPALGGMGAAAGGQTERMREARDLFQQVEEALREGDFSAFGSRFSELAELLGEPEVEPEPEDIPVEPTGGNGAPPDAPPPGDEASIDDVDTDGLLDGEAVDMDLDALLDARDEQ